MTYKMKSVNNTGKIAANMYSYEESLWSLIIFMCNRHEICTKVC